MSAAPPVVLSIAGSDNSAGAGIQADLKTCSALGAYALTAVTCVVAEVPGKVSAIQPVRTSVLAEQIRLSFEAFPVAAVKTGMLYSASIIRSVVGVLNEARKNRRDFFLVVDPVMVATSGDPLLRSDAIRACEKLLFPMASLLTPNMDELAKLTGCTIRSERELLAAGIQLAEKTGTPVLAKGGHLRGKEAVDFLIQPGRPPERFVGKYFPGVETHGTGCTFSAAIAARLAHGDSLPAAVAAAKQFVSMAIKNSHRWKTRCRVLNLHATEHR